MELEELMIPNSLNHMVKYKVVRYMVGSIIFVDNYNEAVNLLNNYNIEANKLNIK